MKAHLVSLILFSLSRGLFSTQGLRLAAVDPSRATVSAPCSAAVSLDAQTNVWNSYTLHPNKFYREKLDSAIQHIADDAIKRNAAKIVEVGTFLWIKSFADVDKIEAAALDVPCDHILGVVLDNLPYKFQDVQGCGNSNETTAFDSQASSIYRTSYIDAIAKILKAHPNTAFALIIEPGAFPDYFNGSNIVGCRSLASSYHETIPYALKSLNLPNIVMYLDIGHSNSMDWNKGRNISAREIVDIYHAAERPSQFRGFATNVANWNSWDLSPGEFVTTIDVAWSRAWNEKMLVQVLSDALKKNGMPASASHAIIDTSRNGWGGLRESWDDWCNIDGAGLGVRPSANTGEEKLDAFVWVKPPGESDGTSDSASSSYEESCGKRDAFKPSPEADMWNQASFEMLVQNAHPYLA